MKFDSRGNALPYPGNTIICDVRRDCPAYGELVALQRKLREGVWADCFAFLPADSFHMTLYRGVNDKRRLREEWPADLPLDVPLETVTGEFSRRLREVDMGDGFRMRPTSLVSCRSGESQLMLSGAEPMEDDRLHGVRAAIKSALRHSRPGEDGYAFHITFSYLVRPMNGEQENALADAHVRLYGEFANAVGNVLVTAPRLCRYNDMLAFFPVGEEV